MRFPVLSSLVLVASAAAAHAAPEAHEVRASALHVRAAPSVGARSLGLIRLGQAYAVLEQRGGWARLQLGGRQAWSAARHLERSQRPLLAVSADELNVRSGPALRFRVLGKLSRGTPLVELGRDRWWVQVSYEGTRAWVHGDHVAPWRAGASAPSPRPSQPSRPRSRAGFVQLPASGVGFESYTTASKRWGVPRLVYGLERAARRWARERRDRIGVGNISRENGGALAPHTSHQVGRDVDLAPVRSDGRELPVTIFQAVYSRRWTARMLDLVRAELPVELALFNDAGVPGVQRWPGHDNHLHVRVR